MFNDDELEFAIGKNGMNVNLASKVTEYKIDAYGVLQYERIQKDQNTDLDNIPGLAKSVTSKLKSNGINIVSNLLEADAEFLLSIKGLNEERIDEIYESVQKFIERDASIEPDSNLEEE